MFFVIEKLEARIREIEAFRYRDKIAVEGLEYLLDKEGAVGTYPPQEGWTQLEQGQTWFGRDFYVWIRANFTIPISWQGRKVVGLFDFQRRGSAGNSHGFESLLFVNQHPYQGVDSKHREVLFPESLVGETVRLDFRVWSGLEGGGAPQQQKLKLEKAEFCWLDEHADDLYFTALAALNTAKELDDAQAERHGLLNAVDTAFRLIDWANPGSDEFYASISEARVALHNGLGAIHKNSAITMTCIGHTHIDVAWLWRLCHTREKGARSFSTVLRLMELYPEYIFMQGQPQLYAYIKEDYPEIYAQIKERVAEGRWEADGGMWVEADCNLSSGEALVRQILVGTRFLQKEFGVRCKYLWLPDVFGYSWALPQILRKSGLDTFLTSKISWNQYNSMPHDTFWWRGIDGSKVLTHFVTTPDLWSEAFYTYNGELEAKTALGTWKNYHDKNINPDLLFTYGFGDGGGGVTREMLEMRRRLENMPGLPHVQTGRADQFFDKLHHNIEEATDYVHTWDGELYLEYHRGTYTTQALNKRFNRKLELALRELEWLGVVACSRNEWNLYPAEELESSWRKLLLHQFHDVIPGSSIREVYEDSTADYEHVQQVVTEQRQKAIQALVEDCSHCYAVLNSGSWPMSGIVQIPSTAHSSRGVWKASGRTLAATLRGETWLVHVENVPAMGWQTIRFEPGRRDATEIPFVSAERGVKTPFYQIEWNRDGQLTSIYDQENKREVLAPSSLGNVLQVFEDKPLAHDAWDIDIFYQQKMKQVRDLVAVDVVECNSLRCVIRFKWRYGKSAITQDMVLYAHNRRIDFQTKVDWHERQHLLKVAFPVDIRATEATYDIQFGNVKRPTHWNTSWDWARFETVGHQWVDLSEEGYGVSLLNDCKYGYDVKDNVLRLSLLKSPIFPNHEADQGAHELVYSLLPHKGGWLEGQTVQQAWAINQPLGVSLGTTSENNSSFSSEGGYVMFDAVKKAEDGDKLVLRLHEYAGGRGEVTIKTTLPIRNWQECNLLEEPCGPLIEGEISFFLKPYEIKTFLLAVHPDK